MNKILIVVTRGEIGGAQTSILYLAKKLLELDKKVVVAYGEGDFLKNNLNDTKVGTHKFRFLKRSHNPLTNLFFLIEFRRYIKKADFDYIHYNSTNTLIGALSTKFLKKKPKNIFTFRGLSYLDKSHNCSKIIKKIYYYYFKFLLKYIDENIFVCKSNLSYALKINLIKKGRVIYNGTSFLENEFLDKHKSIKLLEKYVKKSLDGKYIVGSIGRLAYPKNYEFIINALPKIIKIIPNIKVIIIGRGPEYKKYKELIYKNNVNDYIYMTGEIPHAKKVLKAFDIFVLPSIYEGLSNTLIEAVSAEIPVLTSDVGGSAEIVDHDPRQLFESGNEDEFINNLIDASKNNDYKKSLKEKNKIMRHKFNINNTINEYLKVFNS